MLLAAAKDATAADDGDAIAALEIELDEARRELREFAQGVHPGVLTDAGLMAAVALLAERSPIPVEVHGETGRLAGTVEAGSSSSARRPSPMRPSTQRRRA
jgi:signal transduction histidine kinase